MNLTARYWRFSRKTAELAAAFRRAADTGAPPECGNAHTLSREAATVILQDQWNVFCRDVIVESWRGNTLTASGVLLPPRPGSKSYAQAMHELRTTYTGKSKKSKNWEPKWFDAGAAIDAARRLAVPNFSNIAAGIGSTPSPLDELRAVRNYFAHKGSDTSRRLAPFVSGSVNHASAHSLITGNTLGGAHLFELWVAQLDTMARVVVA